MSDYVIRRATPADGEALMALRVEAEGWLAAAGIDQWRSPGFRDRALAKWQNDIAHDRTWVVEDGAGTAATVTLAPPDMDFWREGDDPDNAVYVAKLITGRRAAGQQLGGRVLDWVGAVARDRRRKWVRLDCWRANTALQNYYLREGFAHVRTEAPAHRLSGWMAQRDATVVMHPEAPLEAVATG
ncbi:GNAT family N-acetyltransferase [Streptomyces reniochalinae]|uniref:GNAT family N-acetyltransferase n=1 Tax=Streptomyces reniochalinae TaxID=2250578 RepID=A0A367E7Z0_9ACTN|nr:GNAT family N-acetyltransferase [Streptomyces reniochalinae]RCG14174.1 GNAT family N-acetyltransferase [Streptomyces reniochalinae]